MGSVVMYSSGRVVRMFQQTIFYNLSRLPICMDATVMLFAT